MPEPSGRSNSHKVAVIGCGLMGAAIARAFAGSGYSVTAWNRTPERAQALAGDGIRPVRSVIDAVRSSPLVVACTASSKATLSALDPVDGWQGATLVNVASGTPDDAERLQRWAVERGAQYLDGAIVAYPQDIGSRDTMILFSGSPDVWARHEQTLLTLGGSSRHVSEQVRAANVLSVAIVRAFYIVSLGAYVEAATYALTEGVSAGVLREITLSTLRVLRYTTEEAVAAIESGHHETDQATLEIYAQGARSALTAIRGAGQPARLLTAAIDNLEAAEAAGLGKLGFYAQTKVVAGAHDERGTVSGGA